MSAKTLRSAHYREMPWRNGRGSTREIAREPARGEEFSWRLSLATVERSCEFSSYADHDRAIALISGPRLELRFSGHGRCSLDSAQRCAKFEGSWETRCTVPEGPCTDLSLIVHKGSATRQTHILRQPTALPVRSQRQLLIPNGVYSAVFVQNGTVMVSSSERGAPQTLRVHDTLLLGPGARRVLRVRNASKPSALLIVLRWRPGISE
jgi:environmental stress-induced protein Ves